MSKKELIKRYILFIIGLFISALGVAITKKGELGVSPISSVANVFSLKFTNFSLGNRLILWNCVLILGQIVVLRKNFKLYQLLQIPLSFLFGWFTDFGTFIISFFTVDAYILRLSLVFLGTAVLAFGIALAIIANVIVNSGEAFVKAIADTYNKEFGNVKICFDVFCVVFAIILSLIFFNMKILGTREGTIIAAIFTGVFVKIFNKLIKNKLENLLVK